MLTNKAQDIIPAILLRVFITKHSTFVADDSLQCHPDQAWDQRNALSIHIPILIPIRNPHQMGISID